MPDDMYVTGGSMSWAIKLVLGTLPPVLDKRGAYRANCCGCREQPQRASALLEFGRRHSAPSAWVHGRLDP